MRETVVLLDWLAVAGSWPLSETGSGIRSTVDVAAAVAPCLYEPLSALGLNEPLAQGPVQLIGHSRGGSLVGELAKDLGEQGLWVDQVTTLDPHPLTNTGLDLAAAPGIVDAPMTAWNNVVFWDNYWEDTFLYPNGEAITGVANNPGSPDSTVPLTFPSDGYPTLSGGSHSDVHLWYQGTLNTEATVCLAEWFTTVRIPSTPKPTVVRWFESSRVIFRLLLQPNRWRRSIFVRGFGWPALE